eukprot:jgi/Phyca11/13649/fgenesh1_pg.PHYCAscaffold_4_\
MTRPSLPTDLAAPAPRYFSFKDYLSEAEAANFFDLPHADQVAKVTQYLDFLGQQPDSAQFTTSPKASISFAKLRNTYDLTADDDIRGSRTSRLQKQQPTPIVKKNPTSVGSLYLFDPKERSQALCMKWLLSEATSKKPSSTGSGPFQTPPAPPADHAVTTRSPPAQATTTQPTSPLQPSSGTQQPLERQTQVKRTRKVPKPPATGKQKRLAHYISLKKPPLTTPYLMKKKRLCR